MSIEWAGPPMMRLNQTMTCQLLVRNTSALWRCTTLWCDIGPSQGVSVQGQRAAAGRGRGRAGLALGTLAAGQVRQHRPADGRAGEGPADLPVRRSRSAVPRRIRCRSVNRR